MNEIINFIFTNKEKITFLKLCLWCNKNNKTKELKEYQNIIIELVKEHNMKIK